MKIVIDISEDDYRKVQDGRASVSMMRNAIRKGICIKMVTNAKEAEEYQILEREDKNDKQ